MYVPLGQTEVRGTAILFRHRGSPVAARAAFHQTLAALDPLLVPGNVASFDEVLAKTSRIPKSVTALFGLCFGFALVLAVSGT